MKTFLKAIAILIVILAALIILIPYFFKSEIIEIAKKEINKNLNAKVDFAEMDLSLIRSFPNFSLDIEKLSVIGNAEFEDDTLADINHIRIVIDLYSVFKGEQYEIIKVILDSPKISVRVLKNGLANYDVTLPAEVEAETTTPESEPAFNLQLHHFQITNGLIKYDDVSSDLHILITGLNNSLSGDFTQNKTRIMNTTGIDQLTFKTGGVEYLSKTRLQYDAVVEADIKNSIYTLGKNELQINALKLKFDGSVSLIEEGINLVLAFSAPGNNFRELLSLVPAIYKTDFEQIQAEGILSIDGSVKGIYNEEKLPAFDINLAIKNGMFKYPDLPQAVTAINLKGNVSNKGGTPDNTVINVSDFSLSLGKNPVNASFMVKTPVSDPDIDAQINGEMDLASVKDFYPLGEDELMGSIRADIALKGRLSAIEKENYTDFVAMGSMLIQNLQYKTKYLVDPVNIVNAQFNFSPQYLDLVTLKMNIGKSDFIAAGKLSNYLSYFFKDGILNGNLNMNSKFLNFDELMAEEESNEEVIPGEGSGDQKENAESSVYELPGNIDFTVKLNCNRMVWDSLDINEIKGQLILRNKTFYFKDIKSKMIDGMMTLNGFYTTANPEKPEVNLKLGLSGIDIPKSYNKLALMRTYLPLAKKTSGDLSVSLNIKALLDGDYLPVYETLNGDGHINTSQIAINDLNTLLKIAEALNFTQMKSIELNKVDAYFKFIDGKLIVSPFTINYRNISGKLEGWTGLDQSIGYMMALNIPRKELGAGANQLLDGLVNEAKKLGGNYTLPENIAFDILIGGTLNKPTVKTGLKQSGNNLIEQAKEELKKEISKEAIAKAQQIINEADKQAKALIAEAEKQAKYLRENADKAVVKLTAETNKQADSLVAIGKKNGLIAEMAAKEASKKLKAESGKKAQQLVNEANMQADKLVNEAKKTASNIKQTAQKQADDLLKLD